MRYNLVKKLPDDHLRQLNDLAADYIEAAWPVLRKYFQAGNWDHCRSRVFVSGCDTERPPSGIRTPYANLEATFCYLEWLGKRQAATVLRARWQNSWNEHFGVECCGYIIKGYAAQLPLRGGRPPDRYRFVDRVIV